MNGFTRAGFIPLESQRAGASASASGGRTLTGFTIIELMVTIAIFTLLTVTIMSFIVALYRVKDYAFNQTKAIHDSRKGIQEMVQFLREADYGNDGSYLLSSAATSSLKFYSNVDSDAGVEQVRYYLDGTMLKQAIVDASGDPVGYTLPPKTRIVARHVRNNARAIPLFVYYNDTGMKVSGASHLSEITFIDATLVIDIDTERALNGYRLSSSVALRNLKSNF